MDRCCLQATSDAFTVRAGVRGVAGVAVLGLALMLTGCASNVARVAGGGAGENTGYRAQVVGMGGGGGSVQLFLPPGSERAMAEVEAESLPEYGRVDGRLTVSIDGPQLATQQWPAPARPSLERPRYIFVGQSPGTVVFYLPEHRYWRERGEAGSWR